MTYKLNRFLLYVLLIILILSGIYVFGYYLFAKEISEIRTLPPTLLTVVIIYIVAQLIKRFFQKETPWYSWIYYIGLVAVITPLPIFSLSDDWIFILARSGTLFLIIPPAIEMFVLSKNRPDNPNAKAVS